MTLIGRVRDGKIELGEPVPLPDGTDVYVEVRAVTAAGAQPETAGPSPPRDLTRIKQELAAFERQLPELLRLYAGQYVAIHHGKLIDRDADEIKLAKRIEERFPTEPVLIEKVAPERRRVAFDSPEVVR